MQLSLQNLYIFFGHVDLSCPSLEQSLIYLYSSKPKAFSKEMVSPYYVGWMVRQESIWADDLNLHVLMCHQVDS